MFKFSMFAGAAVAFGFGWPMVGCLCMLLAVNDLVSAKEDDEDEEVVS